MSISVLAGALGSLAPKVLQHLHNEYKLHKDVKNQVRWLHRELESIYAFLSEVTEVPWDRLNPQVKLWTREVREASYDMEDALDIFLMQVHDHKPARPKKLIKDTIEKICKMLSMAKARRDIAGEVKDIKKLLQEIAERRQKYKLDEKVMSKPITARSTIDPQLTAMHKEVKQLIGVVKSRDELISMMNPSQSDDDVPDKKITKNISIVGVGGLGKTTVAKAVYNNLHSLYDCAAFISVGREVDLVKVFKDILFQLNKHEYQNIHNTGRDADLLINEIQQFLEPKNQCTAQNKRYFVVVDDVWDVQTWKSIKLALVDNNCGSTIITTTRKFDVAVEAGEVYKLKPLSYDDSVKVFYTRLYGADGKSHDYQANEVSEEILFKCGGVPLAIITMASLLAGKPEYEWSNIYNSIGFHTDGNREAEDTMTILSYSYYDVPPHLKTCLLYISKYPEYYLIEKNSLIWMWIAEGFILEKQGKRLFEVGETYFMDLINRSLIQLVETWDGRVLGFRVHDMVLDLLRQISSDENFIALLGENAEGQSTKSRVRRLAHQYTIVEHIDSKAKNTGEPKVRSLRVLEIVHCSFEEGCHHEHLGDLLQLRYLEIRCGGSVPELPKQIGNLKSLQTLDVDTTTLPASIVQLTGLVRLCAEQAYAPDGIGALTSLEELRIGRGNNVQFIQELGNLGELRVLRFSITEMDSTMNSAFVKSLCNLKKIQHIHVFGDSLEFDPRPHVFQVKDQQGLLLPTVHFLDLSIQFSTFPYYILHSALRSLCYLTLRVVTMGWWDLEDLALFPELRYLWLEKGSTPVKACDINNTRCFRKLRYFRINAMVLFQQTDDASVSMHLWSGVGVMPSIFGKSKKASKVVPLDVLPKLEVLQFYVPLRAVKDTTGDCGNIGLEYLPSLREVTCWIDYEGVSAQEGDAMLAALRNACRDHPNNPTLDMLPRNKV